MAAATGMAAAAKTRTQQRYTSHTTGVAPPWLCNRVCVGIQSTRSRRKGQGRTVSLGVCRFTRYIQSVRQLFHGPAPRSPLHRLAVRQDTLTAAAVKHTTRAHALRAPKHEGRYRNIDFFVRTKTAPHYRYSPLLSKLATNLLFQPAQLQETSLILRHTGHRTCAR